MEGRGEVFRELGCILIDWQVKHWGSKSGFGSWKFLVVVIDYSSVL